MFPTAYGVLVDAGRLRQRESVLIHAAAGGVGPAAARIARALGAARVFGTVRSPEKTELATALGYDALFPRKGSADAIREATAGHGVDLVLDPVGGPVRRASLDILAPFGRVVVYGDLGLHRDWTADVWDLWKNNRSIAGTTSATWPAAPRPRSASTCPGHCPCPPPPALRGQRHQRGRGARGTQPLMNERPGASSRKARGLPEPGDGAFVRVPYPLPVNSCVPRTSPRW
ncbi:hypothetical protein QF037_009097 [Streptomyces canus]|uniref:zinc-binding dehydrogenase n=1 Tax=Streptomyces canus TaxID=58343 RepID=UPI00277E5742|nr:zinc-binding dehydrogenase [Streptomyces canus]MDQ0604752.1 hypothetical protein [Streptomyces canus]